MEMEGKYPVSYSVINLCCYLDGPLLDVYVFITDNRGMINACTITKRMNSHAQQFISH